MRIGHGYDAHRLVPGVPLVIGGARLDHERGLAGHSDGDVAVHAIIDALLGAASLGDIGRHFPSTEARWQGADSLAMLEHVAGLVGAAGFAPVNVDLTIVAQEPRLAPHIETMRACVAAALGVGVEQVSIKAKTTDGMGFEGRSEGISATAVALIEAAP